MKKTNKPEYFKVYDVREDTINDLELGLSLIEEGDLIKKFGEVQRYKCTARNERYIILAKSFVLNDAKFNYIILDTKEFICNKDNLKNSKFNYLDEKGARTAIRNLERGKIELAYRNTRQIDDFIEIIYMLKKRGRRWEVDGESNEEE